MHRFLPITLTQTILRRSAFREGQARRSRLGIGFLLSIVLAFSGCTSPPPPKPGDLQAVAPPRAELAPGDVIRLTFLANPELSQVQKIRADGTFSMPLVGEISASGKTIPRLRAEMNSLYKTQLKNSDVVITLESAVTVVYFSGAVGRPGKLTFDRPTTLLQALTEAGGINQFGNSRHVQVIRLIKGEERTQVLDVRPTLVGKTTKPFYVRDGDIVSVPQTAF